MNIYNEWGLNDNPFQTTALEADVTGNELLVGRETELKKIIRNLYSAPKSVTLEGVNGIGKTSVANVAAYRCYMNFIDGKSNELLIPCRIPFQLKAQQSTDDFIETVLLEVAQTLIERREEIENQKENIKDIETLNKWINNPIFTGKQGMLNIMGNGAGLSYSSSANGTTGYEKSGFRKLVFDLVETIFAKNKGGIVCIIDNLELLEKTTEARKTLEELRDTLLNAKGFRWIVCGALGIVRGVVSSPRLEGRLHKPIEIGGIHEEYAKDIFKSRLNVYSNDTDYYLPLGEEEYDKLNKIFRGNIRQSLSMADDYCMWIANEFEEEDFPKTIQEKSEKFDEWLLEECKKRLEAIRDNITHKFWGVFFKAIEMGGEFSPSDHDEFEYKSPQALRPAIKRLEEVQLLTSIKDETDNRRKTIVVTPQGYLVNYAIKDLKVKVENVSSK